MLQDVMGVLREQLGDVIPVGIGEILESFAITMVKDVTGVNGNDHKHLEKK